MMKALIIEDEISALKNLRRVLDDVGNMEIIRELDSITDSIEWFNTNSMPEIIFMDIHLADGSAFEIFNHVKINCPIVFTTAYDEYALRAFKVHSIDYLLKPIETADVKKALAKLKDLSISSEQPAALTEMISFFTKTSSYKKHFLVPAKGDKLIPVPAVSLAYIYIDCGIVKAVTLEGVVHKFDYNLDELMEKVDPELFFRANRQFIISRSSVKDIDMWFNNRLSVNLNVPVPEKIIVSKARITEFKKWFGE
jgi:two-component system LytT family response regulator